MSKSYGFFGATRIVARAGEFQRSRASLFQKQQTERRSLSPSHASRLSGSSVDWSSVVAALSRSLVTEIASFPRYDEGALEQFVEGERNQIVSYRQLARSAVVSRGVNSTVRLLVEFQTGASV